jgi:anti-sigma regulatory factor (Ser/Thr protein kinase)
VGVPARREACLRIPADMAAVREVRGRLADMLVAGGWRDGDVGRVLLAVTEALGNAVEHGSREDAEVDLVVTVAPARAVVAVRDHGRVGTDVPHEPPALPPPTRLRGRGRLIMSVLADRYETRRWGTGFEVVLEFASGG